jgi:hypothetical protein
MQVARHRWSQVLIAGSALTPKGVCVRLWLSQSGRRAPAHGKLGHSVRAGRSIPKFIETSSDSAPNCHRPSATHQ